MGKLVNIVLPDGKVTAVPEEDAARLTAGDYAREESTAEQAARAGQAAQLERGAGTGNAIRAAVEGAADTLSLGITGRLENAINPELGAGMRAAAAAHPTARFAGEAAAMLAPTGLLGDTAKGASELTGLGLAGKAGEATTETLAGLAANPLTKNAARAVGAGGRLVEGGILGAGAYVAKSNVTGDPLSVEGALSDAGIGGVLNIALGGAVDWLGARSVKASTRAANDATELEQLKSDVKLAQEGDRVFKDPPPSWDQLRVQYKAAQQNVATANRELTKEMEAYSDFVGDKVKLNKVADEQQNLIDSVRNERYAKQQQTVTRTTTSYDEGGAPRQVEYTYDNKNKTTVNVEGGEKTLVKKTINTDQRPVITDPIQDKLRAWEKQISDGRKLYQGGYKVDASGKWVKDASVAADPEAALAKFRQIRDEMMGSEKGYSTAGRYLKTEIPTKPVGELRPEVPEHLRTLPSSPKDFARMHAESIATIANAADEESASLFRQFAKDIGMERPAGESLAESFANVHGRFNEYVGTMDRLEKMAAENAAKEASKPLLLKWANKSLRYAAGRAADVGGFAGAVSRTVVGEGVGKLATGLEDSLLAGKSSVMTSIRNAVGKYGLKTANAANTLRPVTSYLRMSFPSGKKDSETDIRKLAASRVNDIHMARMAAPDAMYKLVEPILDHPQDLGYKVFQPVINALDHLASVMPKDPGTDTRMFTSNWTPAHHEALATAYRLEAVLNPMDAIVRALGGDLHPAASETLWAVHPAIMQRFVEEVAADSERLNAANYQQASAFSHLFRVPLSPVQEPAFVATIQGLYMQQAASTGAGGGQSTPRSSGSPGRPAAVQSSVAGSNVSNLIS